MISPADILHGKILIVDDKPANIILLERMLRHAGYTAITTSTDPLNVYHLHRQHHYDLILLDLHMPGMNGFEVMESLKTIETDGYLPVLVITAQPEQKLHALQSGASDFISKPFAIAEVLARVHNLLEVRLLHVQSRKLYEQLAREKQQSLALTALPGAMVGIEKEEHLSTHWFRSLQLRHPWLQVNLLTAFAAAAVVGLFQDTIDRLLILTIFLPVLAGQSGNTGSQALAITLRSMAQGDLDGQEKVLVAKEALLGLLNGILVGVIAALVMYGVASAQHSANAIMLGTVVFIAMTASCIISGICGAIVPITLKRLGADPVTASSIFLTTATDVASMGILLGLASIAIP